MNRLFHHHPLLIGLVGCSALTWSLPLSAATFTWNKNLTPGDTAIYDMWNDANWVIVGTPMGDLQILNSDPDGKVDGGPRTGDSIVVPDGFIARMGDYTGAGNAPSRFLAGITVGSALPGESQIEYHNNYTGKNATCRTASRSPASGWRMTMSLSMPRSRSSTTARLKTRQAWCRN
jgi:hypothetical protein